MTIIQEGDALPPPGFPALAVLIAPTATRAQKPDSSKPRRQGVHRDLQNPQYLMIASPLSFGPWYNANAVRPGRGPCPRRVAPPAGERLVGANGSPAGLS